MAARWAFAHPVGTRARPGAAHAPPAPANPCSSACARALSARPRAISTRHLFHLPRNALASPKLRLFLTSQVPLPPRPTRSSAVPTAPSTQVTRSTATCRVGEAPLALGAVDVPTAARWTDHLRSWATGAVGYLELMPTIVAFETTHLQHLLSRS